jgi:hypothetical protein
MKKIFKFVRAKPFAAAFLAVPLWGMIKYGSTKPPAPPDITERGEIAIVKADVSAEGIRVEWTAEDERIVAGETEFIIEAREKPIMLGKTVIFRPTNSEWYEIGRTKDFELAKPGVWTDKTREIRIRTVLEIGE